MIEEKPTGNREMPVHRSRPSAIWLQIDGIDSELTGRARLPTLDRLRRGGAWSWTALGQEAEDQAGDPLRRLFGTARDAGRRTALIVARRGLRRSLDPVHLDFFSCPGACSQAVAREAASLIWNARPDLCVAQFAAPEMAACRHGWGSPEHRAALEGCDRAIALLLDTLGRVSPTETTLLVVTASRGHTGAEPGVAAGLPWLCLGPRIPLNYEIRVPITRADSASLVAHALSVTATGLPAPLCIRPRTGAPSEVPV